MKKPKDTNKSQTQVRMDEALKDRIRKYQRQLEKQTDTNISFSSAARSLIEKQLDILNI
jgi:hypothetical protein